MTVTREFTCIFFFLVLNFLTFFCCPSCCVVNFYCRDDMIFTAKQETLTPPGHLVSPLVCRSPWMSTVLLYCWCHSDSASVLLYFTVKYIFIADNPDKCYSTAGVYQVLYFSVLFIGQLGHNHKIITELLIMRTCWTFVWYQWFIRNEM